MRKRSLAAQRTGHAAADDPAPAGLAGELSGYPAGEATAAALRA